MGARGAIGRFLEEISGRIFKHAIAHETELSRLAAELQQAQDRLRDYIEVSSDWYWEQDAAFRFTHIAASNQRAGDYLPEDYIGKTRRELKPGGHTEAEMMEHEACLARGEPFDDFRMTRQRSTGGTVHISISGKPIHDADGTFCGYRGIGRDITAQVEAGRAAVLEQQRFAEAVQCMGQGFAVFDAAGELKIFNLKFLEFNDGVLPRIAVGAPIEAFAVTQGEMPAAIAPMEPFERNNLWLMRSAAKQSDGATVLVDVDVSELKAREAEIAARELQFRDFAELSADWFWELDSAYRFSYMSNSYRAVGGDPSSIIGIDRSTVRPSFMRDLSEDPEPAVLMRREGFRGLEHQSIFVEGVWVSSSAKPMYGEHGAFLGYRGVTRDITDQHRLTKRLSDERAAYHAMLDAAPIGFSLVDADGKLVFANAYLAARWNFDAVTSVGQSVYDLLSPEVAEWTRARAVEILETGKPMPFVQREFATHKGMRTVVISKAPIVLPDHDRPGICTITADITGRVRAERVRHDAELRLAQAQRLEALGQLTGGVAHDFNNILSIVMGAAELLQPMMSDNPDAMQMLDGIERSAARGADLVDRLLSYARQQPMKAAPMDVHLVVADLEVLLQRTIGEDVELKVIAEGEIWPIKVDRSQFESALINLALNARDAMPKGGALTIEISNAVLNDAQTSAGEELTSGDYVRIVVGDTGGGIAPETLPHIFDPFFTTKEVGKGSGLGLSMVYGFAKQSGGYLTAESELEAGARIALLLPRSVVPALVDGAPAPAPGVGGGERILVVEDDEDLRALPISMLSRKGYRVTAAADGVEALAAARKEPFDLLFTDLVLPGGMTGIDIAASLRRDSPTLKILFTTGYAASARGDILAKLPDAKVIGKPYRMAELLTAVRDALENEG